MIIRHKKRFNSRLLILSCIITLNVIGVSYSYWLDALFINSTIKTGCIDLEISNITRTNVELLSGGVEKIYFDVINNNDLPVEYKGYQYSIEAVDNTLNIDGINIDYSPGGMSIEVPEDQPIGVYEYNLELIYEQKVK